MTSSLHHQVNVTLRRQGTLRRRDFLRTIPAVAAAAGTLSLHDLMTVRADQLRKQGMACILLWMQGGPSQFETFSPKPDHTNGGETKAMATSVPGIQIAENLPHVSKVMEDLCVIRSMNSSEGSHPRATYLMHTGYIPTASIKHPTLGSIVAHQTGPREFDLPSFVRIGPGRGDSGGGYLGVGYNPFSVPSAGRLPDNTTLSSGQQRYQRRLKLLGRLETHYAQNGGKQEVADHRKLYGKASRMVLSPKMEAFDLTRESRKIREAYGSSQFASGCLLARRLVETGVTFVEVVSNGWDTHQDNFNRVKSLCGQIDQPYAQLLRDLKQRGMLDRTLVVWMGEFGRTPRINPRTGRDHYPRAFNAALAGGGVRGGQVIGKTDEAGNAVVDRAVEVTDLLQTVCRSLKIDADHENMSPIGRPMKIVDGGQAVQEAFG